MIIRALIVVTVLLVVVSMAGAAPFNALQNGSFENGTYSGGAYETLGAGSTAITGWTVNGPATIDWVENYWAAQDGNMSIDLGGTPGPGGIQQTFATNAGQTYNVSFWVSGNWDPAGDGGNRSMSTQILSGNTVIANQGYTVSEGNFPGWSKSNLQWQQESFSFVATGNSSTIDFSQGATSNPNQGVVLDNVKVTPTPEPASLLILGTGLAGLVGMVRRRR